METRPTWWRALVDLGSIVVCDGGCVDDEVAAWQSLGYGDSGAMESLLWISTACAAMKKPKTAAVGSQQQDPPWHDD